MSTEERLSGIVMCYDVTPFGAFGVIKTDDAQTYMFSRANVYHNGSYAPLGAQVTFRVVEWSYATDIDDVEKQMFHETRPLRLTADTPVTATEVSLSRMMDTTLTDDPLLCPTGCGPVTDGPGGGVECRTCGWWWCY